MRKFSFSAIHLCPILLASAFATTRPSAAWAQDAAPAAAPSPAPAERPAQPAENERSAPQAEAGTSDTSTADVEAATEPAYVETDEAPMEEEAPAPSQLPPQPLNTSTEITPQIMVEQTEADAAKEAKKQSDEPHVFAEDWWTNVRPSFEMHGFLRTRAEFMQDFSLGRTDNPNEAIWAQPADNTYTEAGSGTTYGPTLCTQSGSTTLVGCSNGLQAGANIRFRLDPEIHISDNLRIISQIDVLDNAQMGSTPSTYAFMPDAGGGYTATPRDLAIYNNTTVPPASGINSLTDAISVKRVWGEFTTPVGEFRFGRMPNHFGMGMVNNAGNGIDADHQSTIDRFSFTTGLKELDLYATGTWDFPGEGINRYNLAPGMPTYDAAQFDDITQMTFHVMRKLSAESQRILRTQGEPILNLGAMFVYRTQQLANDATGNAATTGNVPNATPLEQTDAGFSRRQASVYVSDLWGQLLYKGFRIETEMALVLGNIGSTDTNLNNSGDFNSTQDNTQYISSFGLALEMEQRLINDKLGLHFDFGYATGDSSMYYSGAVSNLNRNPNSTQVNDNNWTNFSFNPAYRVDLILHRYLLGTVAGSYYFKPTVEYDFLREDVGRRIGAQVSAIWTRAQEFVQTPGHANDLGIELNGRVYFQSKDGSFSSVLGDKGGFYTFVEYGVLFPMSGLGYMAQQKRDMGDAAGTTAAQMLRWFAGARF